MSSSMIDAHFRLTLISVVAATPVDMLVNNSAGYSRQSPRTFIDNNILLLFFDCFYTRVNMPLAEPVRRIANLNRRSTDYHFLYPQKSFT
jgi:hypothetical protein